MNISNKITINKMIKINDGKQNDGTQNNNKQNNKVNVLEI